LRKLRAECKFINVGKSTMPYYLQKDEFNTKNVSCSAIEKENKKLIERLWDPLRRRSLDFDLVLHSLEHQRKELYRLICDQT
jgi:hypothetical protein